MPLMDEGAAAPSESFHNPMLAQIERKVEGTLTPQNRPDYMKIVVAGMKTAMAPGKNGGPSIAEQLHQSQNPVDDAAKGAVNLVALMARQSRGKMPERAFIPAAITLMLNALDFLDRTGVIKVDESVVDRATRLITDHLFQIFGVDQAKLQQMADKSHGVTNNPQSVESLSAHAKGMVERGGAAPPQQQAAPVAIPAGPPGLMNQ